MRELPAQKITEAVKRLCIEANCHLPLDMKECIRRSRDRETWPQAQEILERIIENFEIADQEAQPICQDTGAACVFLKIGQEVHITGDVTEAVNEGVRQGYAEGFLRKSVVRRVGSRGPCRDHRSAERLRQRKYEPDQNAAPF